MVFWQKELPITSFGMVQDEEGKSESILNFSNLLTKVLMKGLKLDWGVFGIITRETLLFYLSLPSEQLLQKTNKFDA